MLLVVTGIILGFGSYINTQIADEAYTGSTITNESVTFTNATYAWLNHKAKAISSVNNYTYTIPEGADGSAYWVSRNVGTKTQVLIYTNATAVAGAYNVTYVAANDMATAATTNSTEGLQALSTWLPIIAVVIAAGVVIGMLFMAFA